MQCPNRIVDRFHLLPLVVSALVIAVASAAASATPADAAPGTGIDTTDAAPGRIAYARHGQINTIEPDGSDRTTLTSAGRNSGPSWSPDGAEIAYVHSRGGSRDLWVMNADGSGAVALTFTGGVSPAGAAWSPDGERLAFGGPCTTGTDVCNDYFDSHFALDTVSADVGDDDPVTALTDDGAVLEVLDRVSWSSTGDQLAIATSGFGSYPGDEFIVVYTMSDGTGDVVRMVGAGGSYGNLANPAFSPDGELLAYDAYIYGQPDIIHEGIVVCGYPTGACDFRDVLHDSQLAFAPAEDRVVLVRDRQRDRMVLADPDGTHQERLAYGAQPSWQPTSAA